MRRKGVSYGLNCTGVHRFTCLISREVVMALSAKRMTENIDMIFIMLS
jgi:hypothetical protein